MTTNRMAKVKLAQEMSRIHFPNEFCVIQSYRHAVKIIHVPIHPTTTHRQSSPNFLLISEFCKLEFDFEISFRAT